MDPLSITVSAVTLASAVSAIGKTLEAVFDLRRSNQELQVIIQELSTFTSILRQIDVVIRESQNAGPAVRGQMSAISILLTKAQTDVQQLDQFVHYDLVRYGGNDKEIKVDYRAWLKGKQRLKALRDDLRNDGLNLSTMLASITVTTAFQLGLQIGQISSAAKELRADLETLRDQSSEQFLRQSVISQELSSHVFRAVSHIDESRHLLTGALDGSLQDSNEAMVDHTTNHAGVVQPRKGSTDPDGNPRQSPIFTTLQYPEMACSPWCSCSCHQIHRLGSPNFLRNIIGSWLLTYSGISLQRQPCDEFSCEQRSLPSSTFTYYFPKWFLARVILFKFIMSPLDSPVASIRIARTRPNESSVFKFARVGNAEAIRDLFKNRLASPFDVTYNSGVSVLQFAVDYERTEVCKLLLQSGADPFLEDKVQVSAMDTAWCRILSTPPTSKSLDELKDMFHDTECLEKREFTVLHKIVLGLVSVDLEQQLSVSTKLVNRVDSNGRTALSWAAARGDISSVQTLLKYRADPNIASIANMVPLHYAVRTCSPVCLRALLNAHATVDFPSDVAQTALHHAAAYSNNTATLYPLLAAGANIHYRDREGYTPLSWAALSNHPLSTAYLLDHGAEIDAQDSYGWSPVFHAVENNAHDTLRVLLRRGANHMLRCFKNRTVLHIVAEKGNAITVAILSLLKFSLFFEGQGAEQGRLEELIRNRIEQEPPLKEPLENLLAGLGGRRRRACEEAETLSGDEIRADSGDEELEYVDVEQY